MEDHDPSRTNDPGTHPLRHCHYAGLRGGEVSEIDGEAKLVHTSTAARSVDTQAKLIHTEARLVDSETKLGDRMDYEVLHCRVAVVVEWRLDRLQGLEAKLVDSMDCDRSVGYLVPDRGAGVAVDLQAARLPL